MLPLEHKSYIIKNAEEVQNFTIATEQSDSKSVKYLIFSLLWSFVIILIYPGSHYLSDFDMTKLVMLTYGISLGIMISRYLMARKFAKFFRHELSKRLTPEILSDYHVHFSDNQVFVNSKIVDHHNPENYA